MNQALPALYALQQIDSALLLAQQQYQALDPGRAEKSAAETARTLYERLQRTHHDTAADLKDSELELQGVEAKKKDYERRLYGGLVSNPKELSSMQDEILALDRQRGRLDERILTLMEQVETRRGEEKRAEQELEAAESALATKEAAYKKEARALAQQIHTLTEQRGEALKPVPPPLLKRYEAIRAAKHGAGAAKIDDGLCGACHTSLPLNLIRRARDTESVELCENCGRILCPVA